MNTAPQPAPTGFFPDNPNAPAHEPSDEPQPSSGQVFSAYTKHLMERFNITEASAVAMQLTTLATALGPSVKIRDPFGLELTPALEFGFCAALPSYEAGVALGVCLASIKTRSNALTIHREITGLQKVRAYSAELLSEIALLEREAAKPMSENLPPFPSYFQDPDAMKRRHEEIQRNLMDAIKQKREELQKIQTQLKPIVLVENPPWSVLSQVEQLSFDRGLTTTSCDGLAFDSLVGLTGRRMRAIASLLNDSQYSRHYRHVSTSYAMATLNCAFVIGYQSLAQALKRKSLIESGSLDGFLFLEAIERPCVEVCEAALECEADKAWAVLMEKLFQDFRTTGTSRVFVMDTEATEIFQRFRAWSFSERFSEPLLQRFTRTWPLQLARCALLFQILSGSGGDDVVGRAAMERAVAVMTMMCEQHVRLVERFSTVAAPELRAVDVMVGKVAGFGRMSRRELFRRYNKQNYAQLEPILQQAIEQGRLGSDGREIWIVLDEPGTPESVSGSASAQHSSEILNP
jgi:hypothetical protein